MDGDRATIVGVLPDGFYPDTMVWRPHVVPPAMRAMRGTGVPVYGRLRPGLDLEAAANELTARLSAAEGKPALRVWLTSLYENTTSRYGRAIGVLSGAVALIVLIACVNAAGLLLARGATVNPSWPSGSPSGRVGDVSSASFWSRARCSPRPAESLA